MNAKLQNQLISRLDFGILSKKSEVENMQQVLDICSKPYIKSKYHTPEEIAKTFKIDEHGNIWWREFNHHARMMNKPADCFDKSNGYNRVGFKGKSYSSHVVAFCLYYGRWPVLLIDHINGIKTDNRKENLREATYSENTRNRAHRKNISGVPGVTWDSSRNQFIARIRVGSRRFTKRCKTLEEAAKVRSIWEETFNFPTIER